MSGELMSLIYCDRRVSSVEDPEESMPFQSVASWTAAGGWKVLGKLMSLLFNISNRKKHFLLICVAGETNF
jgi:hypothetical protein